MCLRTGRVPKINGSVSHIHGLFINHRAFINHRIHDLSGRFLGMLGLQMQREIIGKKYLEKIFGKYSHCEFHREIQRAGLDRGNPLKEKLRTLDCQPWTPACECGDRSKS